MGTTRRWRGNDWSLLAAGDPPDSVGALHAFCPQFPLSPQARVDRFQGRFLSPAEVEQGLRDVGNAFSR
ncbi:MAG: hypothetical protein JWO31_3216 [Phycisphaerales bacterium]|nr:hypothetical protein [Phycisphaerales bacterium]